MGYNLRQNPAHPNNFTPGRQGATVNKIVVHHAATTDFDGIARTFQNPNRAASAHYGVGRNQNVDQYVQEDNIAWHCGNWDGNKSSIGIENVNKTGGPDWLIDDATFNTLVELCKDIANRNGFGQLVVGKNLFGHKDFMATACPGQLYGRLQQLADAVNSAAGGGANPVPTPSRRSNEQIATEVLAGAWGNNPERQAKLQAAGYDYAAVQAIVNSRVGGAPAQPARLSNEQVADQVLAGAWGNGDDRRNRLVGAGYDFNAVQSIVNSKLGQTSVTKASNDTVANQVLQGQWGNGEERKSRLAAAGYDYGTIQQLVNRKLGL